MHRRDMDPLVLHHQTSEPPVSVIFRGVGQKARS